MRSHPHRRALALALVVLAAVVATVTPATAKATAHREIDDYHYVFSADCKPYMTWQARALYDSWRRIGAPGRITRVLTCDDDSLATYEHMDVVPDTVVCGDFSRIDANDFYTAYNLPAGMDCFARERGTDKAWVVKLDADMLLRKPLTVREIPARKGVAAAGEYGYLAGVNNGMAKFFIDDEATLERLAKVGGWEIFDATDFMKLTPLWFEYTKRVRTDSRVWYPYRGTGDVYVSAESRRPWISEMYGFVFGAAISGLSFNIMRSTQLYAGMVPWDEASADPFIVHYGIKLAYENYDWDKHYESGREERMSCESTSKPFPVIDATKPLPSGATSAERFKHVFIDIMRFTVSSINDSVEAYTNERCGRRPATLSREPQDSQDSPDTNRKLEQVEGLEHIPAVDALSGEKMLAHKALKRKMWVFSICVWLVIGVAFARPRLTKKTRQANKYTKGNVSNPFRNV